ncbi:MAG: sulfite exporter TauE/SafE family protein [Rhodospirillales bacterium]|nr:sulfite exporter TauE/SafE family protein [Rhodospirillales bacterium]
MSALQLAGIAAGAVAGGFVSGFTGFGTALTAIGIWLQILPPPVAAMLVLVCSVAAQAASMPAVFRAIEPRRVLPFVLPGVLGVPVGVWLLTELRPAWVRLGVGLLLVGYSSFLLLRRQRESLAWGGAAADAAIGFAGGVLGGLIGLSGALPTLWATLRGWPKLESRTVFQSFNLTIGALALGAHVWAGMLTAPVLHASVVALPAVFLGTWLGVRAWYRVGERGFRTAILLLLGLSGMLLLRAAL